MKLKFDRIISIATLLASITAILLVLKKPQPVATPVPPAVAAANAQSFQNKLEQLEQAQAQGQSGAEVRLTRIECRLGLYGKPLHTVRRDGHERPAPSSVRIKW